MRDCAHTEGEKTLIRIMIVDDMPIFLEYLRGFIHWEDYGFQICGEASNGKEAYDKIEECYPDVILTDITMPYMGGLELAEKVTQQYPDIAVILITGNNEFEYARRALKIGVCDYIVKPFEKEELILSLLKLQDNMGKVIENTDSARDNIHREKERVLRKAILGKEEGVGIEGKLQEVGISFTTDYFLMGCVRLHMEKDNDYEDFLNWESILINMLSDTLRVDGSFEVFRDFQNNILFIINFAGEQGRKSYRAYELLDFPKIIARRLGMECRLCIGEHCNNFSELRKDYYKIMDAIADAETGKVVKLFEGKQRNDSGIEEFYMPIHLSELSEALSNKEKDAFDKLWKKEWDNALSFHNENLAMQLFSSLIGLLMTDIVNCGSSIDNVYGEGERPYTELYMITELDQRIKKLYWYYEIWLNSANESKVSQSKTVAEKARVYIQAHYMEGDLSITDISEELYINQTYLRKMFKEEMGMTLLEFIIKYRMHMAKQLILTTDYSLTQIAEKVGYNDVSYFSKCFKRYYKVSPKHMTKKDYQSFE